MSAEAIREGEAARTYSTSPGLSSPPKSPESPSHSSAIHLAQPGSAVAYPNLANHDIPQVDGGDDSGSQTITVNAKTFKSTAAAPPVKKTRKKRESANTGNSTGTEVKEKKTRKPRAPAGTSNPRKKVKTEAAEEPRPVALPLSRQPKIPELAQPQSNHPLTTVAPAQNGKNEAIPTNDSPAASGPSQPTPRSGQYYDAIRSSTVEAPRQFTNPFSAPQSSPMKSANRASASPSISSLIDPPNPSPVTYPFTQPSHLSKHTTLHDFNAPSKPQMSPPTFAYGDNQLRPPTSTSPSTINLLPVKPFHLQNPPPQPANTESTPMEIDNGTSSTIPSKPAQQSGRNPSTGTSTGPASASHSPKPTRPKDKELNLPPLPSGNGLLSSSLFGGPVSTMPEKQAPTIILHVPLNGEINKYVNFAHMAEERYGFNALHPRLAAQRERLAKVAAAGALLEKTSNGGASGVSADESLEMSEGEGDNGGDSNVEMGGMGIAEKKVDRDPHSKEGLKPVKKRRMREDQYDKDDPFVDDSELAWEEQAAASKDGFFVYSGPLVPEGEKPVVERADGTVKRGRGGRGRGSRGTGAGRGGASGGGASGTRGQGTTRKPRMKKAEKAIWEQEKASREKMAVLVAKPAGYAGPGQ
ncbi:hypothetical protein MMC30_003753 [Trapelia coarctata]|nr:hypothetical protein [Trapelia coarctata]